MSVNSNCNVHDPGLRESKPSQGDPSRPVKDLFRLDKRTIVSTLSRPFLLTGANGFLGTTLAMAILESGGDVVCLDLPEEPTAKNWDAIGDVVRAALEYERSISYWSLDVTNENMVADVFAKFMPTLRYPLRGLVVCAGISRNGPAIDFPISTVREMLDVNVSGAFLAAQAAAWEMRQSDVSGSIVLVASMSGYVSNKGVDTAGYNASKAAVQQLARSLAAEWGSRKGMPLIRVNSLSPGYIRTAATAEALQKPGLESQWIGDNMLYRLSTADEFRAPVLFMLGDGSSFMTGSDLRVDGGHCAW
ncbi:hypothetical protein BDV38DRAFT_292090 [Aspergillus pseudotamarii]|uniref:NAD(P)-binding protein n=1 Tax=Aspergillus pseudotamarii TaxID=132259 RepID=A0A5N6TAT7_ASPPS|nr:uncharacterized protein BDV38DRAFT_292090 [Aspergillus pseudotamarii]KAE8143498.1 hypothetical protein BDV38DRAFT_292090 [Aspergillus pseudotamarii]